MFQYSFCSYSTRKCNGSFCTSDVSIQLLFLFNADDLYKGSDGFSFNTASVLIQQFTPMLSAISFVVSIQLLFLFNPAICSLTRQSMAVSIQLLFLFNVFFVSELGEYFGFNTASVLIQRMVDSWKVVQQCFNTASVLIQPSIFQYSL